MLLDISTLKQVSYELQQSGNKIVFTNGCFDILHSGHVTYLNESKKQGDYLVVGLNSDNSVKRLKGESRPINNENDRAIVLSGLKSVDFVCIFDVNKKHCLGSIFGTCASLWQVL
jgi:glycerol-3-phosphate cytidylyltransferase